MNHPSAASDQPLLPEGSPTQQNTPPAAESQDWLGSFRIVSVLTFFSRILGLIRDMGMAALFGNGPLLDSFTLAFRIPNLCRRLFGEGALSTAFLPEFLKTDRQSRQEGQQLATAVFLTLSACLICLVFLGEFLLLLLSRVPGLSVSSLQIYWMTAWMLPYVVLICLSAQLGAVLHAWNEFAIPAFIPILLNAVWIVAIWFVAPLFEDELAKIQVMMGAVLLGGLAQLLLPLMYLRRLGFRFSPDWRQQWHRCAKVFHLMLPVVIGLSVTQLNSIVDSTLAWWFSQPEQGEWVAPGTASALYFGQRMYQFPLGVFGVALSTVMFARLASHREAGQQQQFQQDVQEGLRMVIVIGFPATLGLMLLAHPLTACLLERGEFNAEDTLQTAAAVAAYATGIWAYLGVSLIQRVFYALEDARTPVKIGLIAVGISFCLNFVFLYWIGGSGLAFATAVAAGVQCLLLLALLRHRMKLSLPGVFWNFLGKTLLATGLMGAACLLWKTGLYAWLSPAPGITESHIHWLHFLGAIPLCLGVYSLLLKLLKIPELELLLGQMLRKGRRNRPEAN